MESEDLAADFVRQWTAEHPDLERLVGIVSAAGRVRVEDPMPMLDALAVEAGGSMPDALAVEAGPQPGDRLIAALCGPCGFRGDAESYGSPDNSRIDQVLRRRRGIPLSLSVVAVLVGRRLGVDLEVLGLPGHVVLRDPTSGRCHDAFDGGRLLEEADLRELVRRSGSPVPDATDPDGRLGRSPAMGVHAIVDRWSRNLRIACLRAGDDAGVDGVLRLELLRRPPPPDAVLLGVERASRRGAFAEAAALLDGHAPPGESGAAWRAQAVRLRARLN